MKSITALAAVVGFLLPTASGVAVQPSISAMAGSKAAAGGFSGSCRDISIYDEDGPIKLAAMCDEASGFHHCSLLDLSHCYAFENNVLTEKLEGNFQQHCHDCVVSGGVMGCNCDKDGTGAIAFVRLDDLVNNDFGVLKCFDVKATEC